MDYWKAGMVGGNHGSKLVFAWELNLRIKTAVESKMSFSLLFRYIKQKNHCILHKTYGYRSPC